MILPDPTTEQAADIVAISRLAVSYSEAICRSAIEEAVLVYADDGVLASATTADAVGREAIAALISEMTKDFEFVFQTTHGGLVHVDGDRAWARFPTTEWAKRPDGTGMQFLGTYEDVAVRTAEGWRFQRRFLHGLTLGRVEVFAHSRTHPIAAPTLTI
ncbi:MAG TPA: nuclear transport factor 2 family protein [Ilumatobacter sp.]